MCSQVLQALAIALLLSRASSSAAVHQYLAWGFHSIYHNSLKSRRCSSNRNSASSSSRLDMVRNVDLPEALVFYGIESMMEPVILDGTDNTDADDFVPCTLRPGIIRLINECIEMGTAALLLCEEVDEGYLSKTFQQAYERASCSGDKWLQLRTASNGKDPAVHFRSLNSVLDSDVDDNDDDDDEYDHNNLEFYNLRADGRSPSPAFLLDSLRSVRIDPRGFGGSSGFGRGQWVEPRRCPMPARTVVFIAGDWSLPQKKLSIGDTDTKGHVKDRCTAARGAGCRVIYVEQVPNQTQQGTTKAITITDDKMTMALCDAVIDTLGSDNPRDLQSITLDAVSTPGDYWLNPPTPRDNLGNSVSVDELVETLRSERVASTTTRMGVSENRGRMEEDNEMSEEEIKAILADIGGQ